MGDQDTVVIVLHGHGARPGESQRLADELTAGTSLRGIGVDGAWRLDDGSLAWFDPEGLDGLDASISAIRSAVSDHGRAERVCLVGASQGAAAALAALGPAGSPPVDSLVLWSGFAVERPGGDLDLDGLAGVEILVLHGDADDVVPLWMGDDVATLACFAGASVSRVTIAGGAHDRTPESIAAVAAWICTRSGSNVPE